MRPVANQSAAVIADVSSRSAQAAFHPVTRYRFVAAGLIAAFVFALPESRHGASTIYSLELVAFGLAHYCLSLHYARTQAVQLLGRPSAWLAAAAVAAFCALFVALGVASGSMSSALLVYFGIHHVFNEVHMTSLAGAWKGGRAESGLRICATWFHASLYTAIVVNDRAWLAAFKGPIAFILLASACAYALTSWRTLEHDRSLLGWLRANAFEIAAFGFALFVCTSDVHVRWTDVVLFHFLYWLLYPTLKLRTLGPLATRRYVTANVGLVIGFGFMLALLDQSTALALFNIGSFFHIATSFALSRAQPAWITRWFWPERAAPVLASSS